MQFKDILSSDEKLRIVQELVPGKQVTLAHVIANPDPIMYRKLGLNPAVDYSKNAIGIVCITPAESAIVFADISLKASAAEIGFVDRFSGTLILLGTVSEVSSSIEAVLESVGLQKPNEKKDNVHGAKRSGQDDDNPSPLRRRYCLSKNAIRKL